jgi:uncharacterized protein YbaR (Trm112 family)/SAM-dependent methyltransferase
MKIISSDVVLEVGSGNNPNPRSDILCDRYLHDNSERAGEFGIVIDRPLVIADGYHLPFADNAFDYVICSHILEHMKDPKSFLAEVERVGKRGYIEVPSAVSERIFGWDFHHWYCTFEKGTLVLRKKLEGEQFKGFFHRLIAQTVWFRRFFEDHENKMYVRYEWNGHITIRVNQQVPSDSWVNALDKQAWMLLVHAKPNILLDIQFYCLWMAKRVQRKFRKLFRIFWWTMQDYINSKKILTTLISMLRCPVCRNIVQTNRANTSLHCSHCHRIYPIEKRTIPILLSKTQIQQ